MTDNLRPLLRRGYDFAERFKIKIQGTVEDLSTATIEASVVDGTKLIELIADTSQANTGNASWATGIVEVIFTAAATAALPDSAINRQAFIELGVTKGTTRLPCRSIPIDIEEGFTRA